MEGSISRTFLCVRNVEENNGLVRGITCGKLESRDRAQFDGSRYFRIIRTYNWRDFPRIYLFSSWMIFGYPWNNEEYFLLLGRRKFRSGFIISRDNNINRLIDFFLDRRENWLIRSWSGIWRGEGRIYFTKIERFSFFLCVYAEEEDLYLFSNRLINVQILILKGK